MADRYDDDRWNARERDAYERDRSRWRHDDRYRSSGSDDRGMMQRAGDEVRSWFGDDEAARRRRRDEERDNYNPTSDFNRQSPERPFGDYGERSTYGGSERGYGSSGRGSNYGSYGGGSYSSGGGGTYDRDYDRGAQMQQRQPYGSGQYGSAGNTGYGAGGSYSGSQRSWSGDWNAGESRDWDRSSQGYGRQQGYDRGSSYGGGSSFGAGSTYGAGSSSGSGSSYGQQSSFDRQSGFENNDRQDWSQRSAWGSQGPHSGRGPRGYQRSDDRIREDICDRLTRHSRIDATDVSIRVSGGEVTLEGSVDSRDAKRLAEDIAESVDGVRDVTNHLKTTRGSNDDSSTRESWRRGDSNPQNAGIGNQGTPSTLGLSSGSGTNASVTGSGSTAASTTEKNK